MDSRVRRINQELRRYDKDLFCEKSDNGCVYVFRKTYEYRSFEFEDKVYHYAVSVPQLIFALTDNWTTQGNAVEWGIEPLSRKLREMDSWRDDSIYSRHVEDRENRERLKERELRNNVKARAYDLRRDFAKVTNDINTSLLEKTDNRRFKDGYC